MARTTAVTLVDQSPLTSTGGCWIANGNGSDSSDDDDDDGDDDDTGADDEGKGAAVTRTEEAPRGG
eukprot:CAMPEP_0171776746 /NCGR_PEP_ID=MMETSP0991-20121206/57351_1 /TAXON_ID=483369 /ORGANISM="non described non described, Strain CCMP2098" /LENGTH=65 /DNA_ID=CAMNT_0012383291 /DNA_START=66 /DNA_END=259 /DNA_ORIENTATION=+